MAPANSKANYKTYEAQARMVRAIVAAHPDVKWNYKEIVACYGSDMTDFALNHRFRRYRAQSVIIREARKQGFDMKNMGLPDDLPDAQERVDKTNIAKYFGQSTADGMQFQFRGIKKDAETLRQTVAANGDAASCLNLSTMPSSSAATTPSRSAFTTPTSSRRSGTGTARKRRIDLKQESSDDEGTAAEDSNYSERDQTPSKRTKTVSSSAMMAANANTMATAAGGGLGVTGQKNVTPRRAAQKANVTIASVAAQLQDSESPTPSSAPATTTTLPSSLPLRRSSASPCSALWHRQRRRQSWQRDRHGPQRCSRLHWRRRRRRSCSPLAAFSRNGSDVCMTSMARPGGSFTYPAMPYINDDFEDGEY
ncbi:hypothetical protein ACCO45_008384 [Purpureocillium lilacinum]|uniref:Uncharacterized protein n=1 Tax=Purpureocillium lilacinum TaxID=33203 RepID=A0ACC4DQU6_PURLI